jgi:hypothetical protein
MEDKDLIHAAKDYVEAKLLQTKHKFDIIAGTVKDPTRKEGIRQTVGNIERDLKKLAADLFTLDDLRRYKVDREDLQNYLENASMGEQGNYRILRNIPVEKLSKLSKNEEINSIWSYLVFFGKEYLGLLSEQNLRLDYGHAYQRDRFFNSYNECVRMMENYSEILEQLDGAGQTGTKDYHDRLVKVQMKQYRDVIIRVGKFLRSIEDFIEDILEAEKNGEKVLMEPDRLISINSETSLINGVSSRQALMDLYLFVKEFTDFLKIPDLHKVDEEE